MVVPSVRLEGAEVVSGEKAHSLAPPSHLRVHGAQEFRPYCLYHSSGATVVETFTGDSTKRYYSLCYRTLLEKPGFFTCLDGQVVAFETLCGVKSPILRPKTWFLSLVTKSVRW